MAKTSLNQPIKSFRPANGISVITSGPKAPASPQMPKPAKAASNNLIRPKTKKF